MPARFPIGMMVGFSFAYGMAIVSTIVRLVHRRCRHQLWWDDMWVAIALFNLCYMISLDCIKWSTGLDTLSIRAQSFIQWTSFWAQATVIWASRLSIQTTIVHVLSPGQGRTISKWAAGGLGISWLVSGVSKLFYNGIPIPIVPRAPWGKVPAVINIILGIIATVWLISWPTFIVVRMRLRRRAKTALVTAFSSAALLFASEIFHCVNLLISAGKLLEYSGRIELVSSVIVANMVILTTFIYRRFNRNTIQTHRRRHITTPHESDPDLSGGVLTSKITQFSSIVEPLTELSSDMHWSGSRSRSGLVDIVT